MLASQTFLAKWGTFGTGEGEFSDPWGIAVDEGHNLYIADTGNNRIQKFTSDGIFVTAWGDSIHGDIRFSRPKTLTSMAEETFTWWTE